MQLQLTISEQDRTLLIKALRTLWDRHHHAGSVVLEERSAATQEELLRGLEGVTKRLDEIQALADRLGAKSFGRSIYP